VQHRRPPALAVPKTIARFKPRLPEPLLVGRHDRRRVAQEADQVLKADDLKPSFTILVGCVCCPIHEPTRTLVANQQANNPVPLTVLLAYSQHTTRLTSLVYFSSFSKSAIRPSRSYLNSSTIGLDSLSVMLRSLTPSGLSFRLNPTSSLRR
jgi:hypothetical protein